MYHEITAKLDMRAVKEEPKLFHLYNDFNVMVCKICAIDNDMHSFKKEVEQGVHRFNYVYLKMKKESVCVQTAFDIVCNEMNEWTQTLNIISLEMNKFSVSGLNDYIDTCYSMINATILFGKSSVRFNVETKSFYNGQL